jgi:4-amino-4-deoxy-L-arabinose transferase-like glycosyltransferase
MKPPGDKTIILLLFLLVSSVYFATISGVTSSNDGSHYALVRALVERRGFEISPYLDFTEHQDYALRGDLRFSDRPPGTALLAAPFYALGGIAPQPLVDLPSKHDAGNPRLIYAILPASLAASTLIVLVYLGLRRYFSISQAGALFASLALAFGTTTWKYGSVLYSHAAAGLVVWLVFYLLLEAERQSRLPWFLAFLLGLALGFAPLTEYTNIPLVLIVGVYLVIVFGPKFRDSLAESATRPAAIRAVAALIVGGAIPLGFLLIYNTLNFGGPFEVSTFHVDTTLWPQNEGLAADFATPLLVGLRGMLFYDGNNQGLFLLAPITLLGLPGLPIFFRHSRRHFVLFVGTFLAYLLLFSKSTTYNSLTNDGRYLTTFVGLWFVPLAFWIDRVFLPLKDDLRRVAASFLVFGLFFVSVRNQLVHIAFSWNYDLDLSQLRPLATPLDNILLLARTVFPNSGNLPLLWAGEGIVLSLAWLITRWHGRQKERLASQPLDGASL